MGGGFADLPWLVASCCVALLSCKRQAQLDVLKDIVATVKLGVSMGEDNASYVEVALALVWAAVRIQRAVRRRQHKAPPSSADEHTVMVRIPTKSGHSTIYVPTSLNIEVSTFKSQLANIMGLNVFTFALSLEGKPLQPYRRLGEFRLTLTTTPIALNVRLLGGGSVKKQGLKGGKKHHDKHKGRKHDSTDTAPPSVVGGRLVRGYVSHVSCPFWA